LEVFPIVPASARALWFIGAICLVLGLVLIMLAWVGWSSRHSRVELTNEGLRLVGDLWGRSIPLGSLDLAASEVVVLDASSEYRPVSRTFGTGMPGYASGWLRLRNGEKALAYLTTRERVVRIPTSDGYSLLLSVADPDGLLGALRARQTR
jgi:hypothetical protein